MEKIRAGIVGYGNLGKGVECALRQQPDMELVGVFTRRDPAVVELQTPGVPVLTAEFLEIEEQLQVDVLIICGGSAKDLPRQTPRYAQRYNVVDSFDTHAEAAEHFRRADQAAKDGGNVAILSAGWDPGLFSWMRAMNEILLPSGRNYTFWGKGISQGHSDALRRIPGVRDARQYTVPAAEKLAQVRDGSPWEYRDCQAHRRECYVVAEEGADLQRIEEKIRSMKHYFAGYETEVHFIDEETLLREHSRMPHAGSVIRQGRSGWQQDSKVTVDYSVKMDSNPEFTACVLTACARAAVRLSREGETGARTLFDLPLRALAPFGNQEFLEKML